MGDRMKELIQEQINQISHLEDRVILKELLNGVFWSLYEENEKMYQRLEERVFDELEYRQKTYGIKTNIIDKKHYDRAHHLISPMLKEDLEELSYDMEEIAAHIKEEKPFFVKKAFAKCDYLVLKKLLLVQTKFQGELVTDRRSYTAYFHMEQDGLYEEKIRKLYRLFTANGVEWNTVNSPYASRMLRIYLDGLSEPVGAGETIREITVDFAEYSSYIHYDMLPVWNIREMKKLGVGFPIPCVDHINFEHMVSTAEWGERNGYLVDDKEGLVKYVRQQKNSILITGEIPENQEWDIYMIIQAEPKKIDYFPLPFMTNDKKISFTEKLAAKSEKTIKTKAELIRFIEAFSFGEYVEFLSLKIQERKNEGQEETYSMNGFIEDEIRDKSCGKDLVLYFKGKKNNFFAIRDIMSFLTSEVQRLYPEYRCLGKLR